MAEADKISFKGIATINGKEYFHILASEKEKNYEFWITNDAYMLPYRFVITYKTQKGSPQYQAVFSEWMINPDLPASMFNFMPPPNARQIRIMANDEK